jgi:hypothetical protein
MVKVFISYHRKSSSGFSNNMKRELEKNGIKCWLDDSEMNKYSTIYKAMADGVEKSDFIILCINREYSQSDACKSEAYHAKELNKHIIALIMEEDYKPSSGYYYDSIIFT